MKIYVDFKTTQPKIAEEIIIAGAFETSGTINCVMTLKGSVLGSFSRVIKILVYVIIQPPTGSIREQTTQEALDDHNNRSLKHYFKVLY